MSLEKTFEENIIDYRNGNITIECLSNQCVQICDEFAVGFNVYIIKNTIDYIEEDGLHWYKLKNKGWREITELLEIYKQGL